MELQQVSSFLHKLMSEQVEADGKLKLQQEGKACLLRLPMEPSAMFKLPLICFSRRLATPGVRMICVTGWMQVETKGTRK